MSMALQNDLPYHDLEQLADEIGIMLQCPITIEDLEHRLLGYSSHVTSVDPVRIATIVGRRVPEHVTEKLKNNGVIEALNHTGEATYIEVEHGGTITSRIAIAVKHGARPLGYIWALVDNKESMSEAWYDQLELATALVAKELLRLESAKRNLKSASEQFFLRLIQGEFSSNAVIQSEASKLQVQLPGNGALVVIQLEEVIGEGVLRKEVKRWLELHDRKKSMYSIVNGMIVLLLDQIDDKHLQAFQQSFEGQLHTLGYHAAILVGAAKIIQYDQTSVAFQRANDTIIIKKSYPNASTNIYYYENLGYIHFLSEVTRFVRKGNYVHSGIESLRSYDAEHASELLKTLKALLDYDCQTKEVIKKLHIHPNTLSYRVQRIQEISGIDLKSMSDKVTCYLYLKCEHK